MLHIAACARTVAAPLRMGSQVAVSYLTECYNGKLGKQQNWQVAWGAALAMRRGRNSKCDAMGGFTPNMGQLEYITALE